MATDPRSEHTIDLQSTGGHRRVSAEDGGQATGGVDHEVPAELAGVVHRAAQPTTPAQKLAIEREEKYLDGKFGKFYRDYRKKVRRWL